MAPLVLAARREDNAKNGTLAFWTEAVKRELTAQNYKLSGSEDVESAGAIPGKLMTFSTTRNGRDYTYMTAVFIRKDMLSDGEILVSEAGGETSLFKPRQDEIRNALLTVR